MACNPPVSVVMPVHNGSRFVAEAMQSVFAQTFTDFEFIVVDDGSTDDTAAIVASFRDDRLVALRHPSNLGLRAALNTGCRHARGPFIARMDADDVCAPGRFAAQVEALRRDERIGVIGSAVQLIDAEGRPLGTKAFPEDPALVAWSMFFFNSVAHPAVMMRRDIAAAAGFYPAGCAGGTEDYALFIRLSRGTRITNLPEPLLSYRVSTTNMTRQRWDEQ
jgi:glycosyltransferase involved in cell wall biosynthesis